MNKKRFWALITVLALSGGGLVLLFLLAGQIPFGAAIREMNSPPVGSSVCDPLIDPMERDLCLFVTGIYSDGLLTNWPNPRLPGHLDHAPMRDHGEEQWAISESASMLALYAALIGDQTTFDFLFNVSAPAEIGGTGAPISRTQESPYYFASPNLCLLHWILTSTVTNTIKYSSDGWLASAPGEENRWLEALSIADQKFPNAKYRLFANCLAWGLMGATDFDPRAVGVFEDPGTPETFDDYVMRTYFGWQGNLNGFAPGHSGNLSYNNLMGWRFAAQLGQGLDALYQTTNGTGGTETITVPLQVVDAIRIDMTGRGTEWGYSLREVEAHNPFTDTNLLLDADCAASSHQNDVNCPDCTCQKALDGELSTRWSSEQPSSPGGPLAPQWLVITPTRTTLSGTITQPKRVVTITLHWETAYASNYDLTASWPFAAFYSKVLSHTAPVMTGSIQQCGTDLPRVMYDVGRHVYYAEILTPNLVCAMAVTATASSVETPTLAPGNVIDCDPDTRWSSTFTDGQWIALEFSEPITMDGVVLKWERAYGKAYTIDVSDDGGNWKSVYTETNGHAGDNVIHFPLTTTRHIRMHGLSRGTESGYSLWEFEIYQGGGTSSLTALDLARRAGVYATVSGDTDLWQMGRRILDWYKSEYTSSITPTIAAAYDPCTGDPLPGSWQSEWTSVVADLAELAAEYGDCYFARQVINEKLRPRVITDTNSSLYGSVGQSAFDNLEVLLALRHLAAAADLAIIKSGQPSTLAAGAWLTYTLVYSNKGLGTITGVLITDVVPITLTNISVTSSGAQITPTGGVSYTWQVEDLSPGEGGVVTLTAQVSPLVSGLCNLTNEAMINTTDVCYVDEHLDDNRSIAHITCVYLPLVLKNCCTLR